MRRKMVRTEDIAHAHLDHDLTFREIARLTGLSVGTVWKRLERAGFVEPQKVSRETLAGAGTETKGPAQATPRAPMGNLAGDHPAKVEQPKPEPAALESPIPVFSRKEVEQPQRVRLVSPDGKRKRLFGPGPAANPIGGKSWAALSPREKLKKLSEAG